MDAVGEAAEVAPGAAGLAVAGPEAGEDRVGRRLLVGAEEEVDGEGVAGLGGQPLDVADGGAALGVGDLGERVDRAGDGR